jgi:hypothetical protein
MFIYGLHEYFDFEGIVYMIGRQRLDSNFDALYCGQSGQGDARLSKHEKMNPARQLGATHVHVLFIQNRTERFRIETDLRREHKPRLNEQSIPVQSLPEFDSPYGTALNALSSNNALSMLRPHSPLASALAPLGMAPPRFNSMRDLIDSFDSRSPLERALLGRPF